MKSQRTVVNYNYNGIVYYDFQNDEEVLALHNQITAQLEKMNKESILYKNRHLLSAQLMIQSSYVPHNNYGLLDYLGQIKNVLDELANLNEYNNKDPNDEQKASSLTEDQQATESADEKKSLPTPKLQQTTQKISLDCEKLAYTLINQSSFDDEKTSHLNLLSRTLSSTNQFVRNPNQDTTQALDVSIQQVKHTMTRSEGSKIAYYFGQITMGLLALAGLALIYCPLPGSGILGCIAMGTGVFGFFAGMAKHNEHKQLYKRGGELEKDLNELKPRPTLSS